MNDYHEKILKSAATFLNRWNGGWAQLLELTVSHKTLLLLITKHEKPGNLLLSCSAPLKINSIIEWPNCMIAIETVELDKRIGFRIYDKEAPVDILCEALSVRENVKLGSV